MLVTLVRTLVLYSLVVITMRVMGKRQIGQLEPYELVIAIMIAELAAVPMQDLQIPLINGFISILTLLFVQVTLSTISLKSRWFRHVLDGRPSIVIANGQLQEEEMRTSRYNMDELLEQLRTQGYPNIQDVEYAILETSGDLSVIPKSQKRPVTPQDLGIETAYEGLSLPMIIDGQVISANLTKAKLDMNWLKNELANHGIHEIRDVFFATLDTDGAIQIQTRANSKEKMP